MMLRQILSRIVLRHKNNQQEQILDKQTSLSNFPLHTWQQTLGYSIDRFEKGIYPLPRLSL